MIPSDPCIVNATIMKTVRAAKADDPLASSDEDEVENQEDFILFPEDTAQTYEYEEVEIETPAYVSPHVKISH